MKKRQLKVGDVLQLGPRHPNFPAAMVVVTEPKHFGAMGYLMSATNFEAVRCEGLAYVFVKFEDVDYVGKIQWMCAPKKIEEKVDDATL